MAIDELNPYARVMQLRREFYRRGLLKSWHPGIPVISVGNLSVGGTGKSPLTIEIARHIQSSLHKRVAIVSRGYGRRSKGYVLVRDGSDILAKVAASGDESQMIAEMLPEAITIVDEDRVHGARQATLLGADVILLDDGFQHLRLQRDLNIVLIDQQGELSNVLPFGDRREPLSSLSDADVIVFTNAEHMTDAGLSERLSRYTTETTIFASLRATVDELVSLQKVSIPIASLSGKTCLAVSSVARPERFHGLLRGLGAQVIPYVLRDHAKYDEAEIERIMKHSVRSAVDCIVTTEKDLVKSHQYFERNVVAIPVYVLRLKLEFLSGKEGFYDRIDQLL